MNVDAAQLMDAAERARKNAYAPYSDFLVGAAIATADGEIFAGCNVENASYGLAICAERNAIAAAVSSGHRSFSAVAITANPGSFPRPCGACRQVLAEFLPEEAPVFIKTPDGMETFTMGELLPHAFKLDD